MIFNPDPTKSAEKVIFTKRNSTSYDTLIYSGSDVEPVDDHKHLGFVSDGQMSSNKPIDGKMAKENQGIDMIGRLKILSQIYVCVKMIRNLLNITHCTAQFFRP